MTVRVVPYSDHWPTSFEQEAQALRSVLAPWLDGGVHHVGSTAIPGLPAKPILDMLAGVRDLEAAHDAIPVLGSLGYTHAEHRAHEALWFYKQPGDDYLQRTHQLHLTVVGSDLWRERLAFRDAIRADSSLRLEYQALKEALAGDANGIKEYTKAKRGFVARVLRARGIELD